MSKPVLVSLAAAIAVGAFVLVMKDDSRSTVQVSERQTARVREFLSS